MHRKLTGSPIFVLLLLSALACASSPPPPPGMDRDAGKGALMRTDSEFSKLSEAIGAERAPAKYVAPEGILLGAFPASRGLEAVHKLFFASPAEMVLTWRPVFAEIASSGELGYTAGEYELRSGGREGPIIRTGKYVTIWKRQPDRSWKFVLDGGTPDPPAPPPAVPRPGP